MSERPAGWLSDREIEEVDPADKAAFRSPVPTQVVSNGEYNPMPQTEKQRQVEGLIKEYADKYSKYHGVDRRRFLKSASGFAAAFLAMNKVFGPVFEVSEAEAADRDMADERAKRLSGQFIFDDQTHFVRDDFDKEGILGLGKYAVEHWNPKMAETPMTLGPVQVRELSEGDLPGQRHQGRAAVLGPLRRSDLVPAVQQPDPRRPRRHQQHRRQQAHVRAFGVHARPGRLDGGGRPLHRRVQAGLLEGLHHRRPAVAVLQGHRLASR